MLADRAGIAWRVIVPTEKCPIAPEENRFEHVAQNRHRSETLCNLTFKTVELDRWGRLSGRYAGFVKIRLQCCVHCFRKVPGGHGFFRPDNVSALSCKRQKEPTGRPTIAC